LVIVLQFVHPPPATTATVSPQPDAQGNYPGPATVTLGATAASGYAVAATYYRVDNGPQQTYAAPFTVAGDGTHTVQYWSVDTLGVYEFVKTLTIRIASLRISTEPPLPAGYMGQPYAAPLAAAGGMPPYTWSIVAGALPPGLSIDAASGLIAGTPSAAGTYGFTVQVRDSANATATKPLALAPPPPSGNAGSGYSAPVTIDPNANQGGSTGGGSTPSCTNYTVTAGALPPGLALDPATGLVSGTPLNGGAYTFTIGCTVTNGPATGQTATKEFTITIYNLLPEIASLSPALAVAGSGSFELTVNGANFVQSSVVRFHGADRPTTFVSSAQLKAQIPAADVAAAGSAPITVFNPPPNGGASNAATFTIVLPNAPPTASAGGPYNVDEGSASTLAATASDPDADPLLFAWDLDGDSVFETPGQQVMFSAAGRSGPSTQAAAVQVCDDDNACTTATATVHIGNVRPTANAGGDQAVYRNDMVTVAGTWTDPAGALDNDYTWRWDLDGDGTYDESGSAPYGTQVARTVSFVVPGTATLSFQVTDKDGGSTTDTVQIVVSNRAPVAPDQSLTTAEDTSLEITLGATDADNDGLTFTLVDLPQHGTLEGTAPGVTYVPDANYYGPDSFTFQANDGIAESNVATVRIEVLPVNDPPAVLSDSAGTTEDTPVTVAVLANDSAGPANEDQALAVTGVADPAHGAATANADGTITYAPDLDYNGLDTFSYTACDAGGACASSDVTIAVATVNDPPLAADDVLATDEDIAAQLDVSTNDTDVDGNLVPASAVLVTPPANGSVAALGSGIFAYTPAADYAGLDSFTYRICDAENVCAAATVAITVRPVNDPPVCTAAIPSLDTLWPPDHRAMAVEVNGVTDVEGDVLMVTITGILQDEPTNGLGDGDTSPDGGGIGTATAQLRAERSGKGNGRIYHVTFSAGDGQGGVCTGTVLVGVPKSQGAKGAPVDDGPRYDATKR
jgi:hypothetical protein